ncbi:hypothetical protein BELL_0806g00030 [Botrytis elliptica]|uniref:Uncharacterized protein n=6 Tax=Sclerotiniaceae TaxID=28983 RepID=A0A4Z1JBC5_9HELO|nr:hypothetical protein BELL_0806g00030 [Botrytis elliptica]
MRLMKSLLTRDLGEFFESMKYLCLGWHPQSSWLHETKVFSGESGSYEIGHLSSTPIVSAQHSTSRPYLFYNLSNAYTGLDSRIISTRLGGLRKLGASMTSPCLDTVLSKLYHKKLLEDYHKKLLKVYHEEMGDAAAMPLPDEDDKNYTTKQHYTGLFRMSQVNHIQDGEKEDRYQAEDTEKTLSIIHNPSHKMPSFTETPSTTANAAPNTTTVDTSNQSTETVQKTEAQLEADRLYEERIEEEYAKREGGA